TAILFTLVSAPSSSLPVYTQTAYADENSNSESNSDSEGNNSEGSQEEQASDTEESSDENPNQAETQDLINKANDGSLTEDEKKKLKTLQKQGIIEQHGNEYVAGAAAKADNNLWTLYSRILMESGKAKEATEDENKDKDSKNPSKMIKNTIGEFMGDDGVEVNIHFNEMYSI